MHLFRKSLLFFFTALCLLLFKEIYFGASFNINSFEGSAFTIISAFILFIVAIVLLFVKDPHEVVSMQEEMDQRYEKKGLTTIEKIYELKNAHDTQKKDSDFVQIDDATHYREKKNSLTKLDRLLGFKDSDYIQKKDSDFIQMDDHVYEFQEFKEHEYDGKIKCPHCGSTNTSEQSNAFPTLSMKNGGLQTFIKLLLDVENTTSKKSYVCNNCHKTW